MTNRMNTKSSAAAAADVPAANDSVEEVAANEFATQVEEREAEVADPIADPEAASAQAAAEHATGPGEVTATKSRRGRRPRQIADAAAPAAPRLTKTEAALKLLRRKTGASLAELQDATGWQAHSVRGFLSGTVRKKLALPLSNEIGKQGVRRYRIAQDAKAG